jgi:hypothetical protein
MHFDDVKIEGVKKRKKEKKGSNIDKVVKF